MANSTIERQEAMAINKFFLPKFSCFRSVESRFRGNQPRSYFQVKSCGFLNARMRKSPTRWLTANKLAKKARLHLKVADWQNKQICTMTYMALIDLRLVLRYQKEQLVSIDVTCSWLAQVLYNACTGLVVKTMVGVHQRSKAALS